MHTLLNLGNYWGVSSCKLKRLIDLLVESQCFELTEVQKVELDEIKQLVGEYKGQLTDEFVSGLRERVDEVLTAFKGI